VIAPFVDDLADPCRWHAQVAREAIDTDAEIGHELFAQDLTSVQSRA